MGAIGQIYLIKFFRWLRHEIIGVQCRRVWKQAAHAAETRQGRRLWMPDFKVRILAGQVTWSCMGERSLKCHEAQLRKRGVWPAWMCREGGSEKEQRWCTSTEGPWLPNKGIRIVAIGHTELTTVSSAGEGCTECKASESTFCWQAAAFTGIVMGEELEAEKTTMRLLQSWRWKMTAFNYENRRRGKRNFKERIHSSEKKNSNQCQDF